MSLLGTRADRIFDIFARCVVVFAVIYLAAHIVWAVVR